MGGVEANQGQLGNFGREGDGRGDDGTLGRVGGRFHLKRNPTSI